MFLSAIIQCKIAERQDSALEKSMRSREGCAYNSFNLNKKYMYFVMFKKNEDDLKKNEKNEDENLIGCDIIVN